MQDLAAASVIAATRQWIENVVMGLGLCPFVRPFFATGQIRYHVSEAVATEPLLHDLAQELLALAAAEPAVCETTLLIHPHVLGAFPDYNEFLDDADALLEQLELQEVIQVVSFHPHYQFAGTTPEQIDNFTNRSPFPMLHLLRQASVDQARATYRDIEGIPDRNIATLQNLSPAAKQRLRGFRF